MADGMKFEVKGARETVAALNDLADNIQRRTFVKALKDAATSLAQLISLVAPRSDRPSAQPGRLAENIAVRTSRAGGVLRGRVVVNTVGGRDNPHNAFYWRFLERGWHDRAGREHSEPFVGETVEGRAAATAQRFVDALGSAIETARAKAARA